MTVTCRLCRLLKLWHKGLCRSVTKRESVLMEAHEKGRRLYPGVDRDRLATRVGTNSPAGIQIPSLHARGPPTKTLNMGVGLDRELKGKNNNQNS